MSWTKDFSIALEMTIQSTTVVAEGKPQLTLDQYAQAIRSTELDVFQRHHLISYRIQFKNKIDKISKLISIHPEVVKIIEENGKMEKLSLSSIRHGVSYENKQFSSSLARCVVFSAALFGIPETIQRFERFLKLNATMDFVGFEFTFLAGLNLSEKWTIAEKLHAVPYDHFRREYLNSEAIIHYDSFMRHDPIVKGPEKPPHVAVIIQEFKWGPAIIKDSDSHQKKFTYCGNDGKVIDVALLVNLLSMIGNCPLGIIGQTERAEPWFYDLINRGFDLGLNFHNCSPIDFIRRHRDERLISSDKKIEFEQLVPLWLTFSESDGERIGLAISRLAGAMARTGSLAEEDRILDVAIALEILYVLPERVKLSERASEYLSEDSDECIRIKDAIELFYDWRVRIVHGLNREDVRGSMAEAFSGGFDIAVRTIRKHLKHGCVPWKRLRSGAGRR